MLLNDLVFLKNDEAMTNSLIVAEKFHKKHKNVIQTISNQLNFQPVKDRKFYRKSSYTDSKGEKRTMYLMNRQGFEILVMGFTGKKALEWKIKYSDAFAAMEKLLLEKSSTAWVETRAQGKFVRKEETRVIKELAEYARAQGSKNPDKLYMVYSKLANKMAGISSRDNATVLQLNMLAIYENIIQNVIENGIKSNDKYKDIYQACKRRCASAKNIAML